MYKLIILPIFLSIFFLNWYVNAAWSSTIEKISFVKIDGSQFLFDILWTSNKIPLKYLLSDDNLFEISGTNFIWNNYEWTLQVVIDDVTYNNQVYYKINTENKIYFWTKSIRELLLDSKSKNFKFKFCPITSYGQSSCSESDTLELIQYKSTYNDTYSNLQYYMEDMNIIWAKKTIDYNHIPVVAIIDDGVSLLHDDLKWMYWINQNEIHWNGIDDDNNWYVDDYYGWNFVADNNVMLPNWDHWTNVAWVIWSVSNNNLWITWILDKVKLMPIVTCSSDGCSDTSMSNSIYYAVDNWADIINMSLWGQWFVYNNNLTSAIEYANKNWVIIVVSAWNWDKFLTWKGVDTSLNKISPVCNWEKKEDIIGVSALALFSDQTKEWELTSWSNYWSCADFAAYGESIVTISKDWGYVNQSGTSFSSPIIAGIIWLWYAQYWKVDRTIIYNSLAWSINKWHGIDAEKYIQNLKKNIVKSNTNNIEVVETAVIVEKIDESIELKNKYKKIFSESFWSKLEKFPVSVLKWLVVKIDKVIMKTTSSKQKKIKLEALKEVIIDILKI
jgi:hypothetical protein